MTRILLVEDNENNLYLARFLLKNAGFEVIEARDGLEAVKTVSRELPDLVLMDMQLPELDGYEATRRIRSDETTARVPVVAMTAYAMKGDREKAGDAGCTGYIKKPIDPAAFVDQVKAHL
ncbi:MAG: response regulator [Desulfarculaceae bacterium]|nr:response regulator [Desulfarculaceae bacterium]